MRHRLILIGLLLAAMGPAAAHELLLETAAAEAAVIRLHFADGEPYAYEEYELYRGDDTLPHQLGRSSADGLILFLPGDETRWRLRSASADGHGVDTTLSVEAGQIRHDDRPLIERYPRVVVGLSILFGLFGLYQLFVTRLSARRRPSA